MPSKHTLQAKREQLIALADGKVGYISKAWRDSISRIKDMVALEDLIKAVRNNDVYAINRQYAPETIQLQLIVFKHALTTAYVATGATIASQATQSTVYFNGVNPRLTAIVNNWSNTLITNETQATIQTIGRTLGQAALDGVNPIESARRIRNNIGLTPQQQQAIANYERALREGKSPTSYRLRDKRFDGKKTALTEDDIIKRVERYTEKQLKFRSEMIARTESLRMVNMANQHIYENAIEEGTIRPDEYRKYWVATQDSKTRDAHRTLPSMNKEGRAINEPFKSTLGNIMYPHDPLATAKNTINCRCVCIYDFNVEAFA